MLAAAPISKALLFAGLEASALLGLQTLIRAAALVAVTWLFALAFRHRHPGLEY